MAKLPWNKRLETCTREREEAEARLEKALHDDYVLKLQKDALHREVVLNDWTATAKRIFAGRDE